MFDPRAAAILLGIYLLPVFAAVACVLSFGRRRYAPSTVWLAGFPFVVATSLLVLARHHPSHIHFFLVPAVALSGIGFVRWFIRHDNAA